MKTVNTKEYFSNYIVNFPKAKELTQLEKFWIGFSSAVLGIVTGGMAQLICYAAFKNRKASLFTRHQKDHNQLKRIQFLTARINQQPENEALKKGIKAALEQDWVRQLSCADPKEGVAQIKQRLSLLKSGLEDTQAYREIATDVEYFIKVENQIDYEDELKQGAQLFKFLACKNQLFSSASLHADSLELVIKTIQEVYKDSLPLQKREIEKLFFELGEKFPLPQQRVELLVAMSSYYVSLGLLNMAKRPFENASSLVKSIAVSASTKDKLTFLAKSLATA